MRTLSDASSSFIVVANSTNGYAISAAVAFVVSITVCTTGSNGMTTCSHASAVSAVTVSEEVQVRALVLTVQTHLVNVTDDTTGFVLRNPDGSFYRNDSFCVGWNASFEFSAVRTDIRINVTSLTPPSLSVLNYTSDPLGRTGSFCYDVRTDAGYGPYNATLAVRALDWQGVSMGLEGEQPAVRGRQVRSAVHQLRVHDVWEQHRAEQPSRGPGSSS